MVLSTGHDMSDDYKFDDGLGQTYAIIAGVWTTVLAIGVATLVYYRQLSFLKIRNVPLLVAAVITLHIYWVLCLIAYGLNGHWPCLTEFWIMNIYLPLGIALFHASNAQLLFIARAQQKYTYHGYIPIEQEKRESRSNGWRRLLSKLSKHRAIDRTVRYISLGIVAQMVVSSAVFFMSRRFVPAFGVIGDDISNLPLEESRRVCRQGFEWLPSIFWQFFWAWVYAPYVLWNVRHIHDIHGWRIQTICCCLVGLPASPMWLLALYLPSMASVNRYYIPPLWFVPSIFLMEFFMVFAPCWQIIENRKLKKETLEILAEWERQKNDTSLYSGSTQVGTLSTTSKNPPFSNPATLKKARSHMYTMAALEKALETNAIPLLMFAALRDFSGENISFLIAAREWKQAWLSPKQSSLARQSPYRMPSEFQIRKRQFHRAVEIYASFVSLRDSAYPINLSSSHLKSLVTVFEEAATNLNSAGARARNTATPFDEYDAVKRNGTELTARDDRVSPALPLCPDDIKKNISGSPSRYADRNLECYRTRPLGDQLPENISVPSHFDANVFDEAIESIKYTVLTNTWPKFVNAGYAPVIEKESPVDKFCNSVTAYRTGFARLLSFQP